MLKNAFDSHRAHCSMDVVGKLQALVSTIILGLAPVDVLSLSMCMQFPDCYHSMS